MVWVQGMDADIKRGDQVLMWGTRMEGKRAAMEISRTFHLGKMRSRW